jgi:hypothetical protein
MPQTPTIGQAQRAPMPEIPFPRASRDKSITFQIPTFTYQAGAAAQLPIVEVPPGGFIEDIELYVTLTTGANAAAVALTAGSDVPFSLISSIALLNASGDNIIQPISGYDLYLHNKWGGVYATPNCDPRAGFFSAPVTGAVATGGQTAFPLIVPIQRDPRDAFCALPNMAGNRNYQLQIGLASLASVFATPPNGAVQLSITAVVNYWSEPNPLTPDGYPQQTAPNGVGSVALIRKQIIPNVGGGQKLHKLTGVGNTLRSAIFVLRNSAGIRVDADFPLTTALRLNNDQWKSKPVVQWRHKMRRAYGYQAVANDVVNGLDTGVYVLSDFMEQHGNVQVDHPRDQYLNTVESTLLHFEGVFGAASGNFEIITDEIKATSAQALYSLNVV